MQETQEMQVSSPGWEDPLEKGMTAPPVFMFGETHRQKKLAVHEVAKSQTQLND